MSHMHNVCSLGDPSTGLNLPQPVGMGVARLGHLICNLLAWILYRIWSLTFWPCLGSRVGLTLGLYSQNFRLGPVRTWLCWELLVGVDSWAGKLGVLLQ